MTIHQLIYTSEAIPDISESVLMDILQVAQTRNSEHKISGVLIFHRGAFLQLLEGDEQDVSEIYSSIMRDRRHTNIRILYEADCASRCMPAWLMGFSTSQESTDLIKSQSFHIPFEDATEICGLMSGMAGQIFQQFIDAGPQLA